MREDVIQSVMKNRIIVIVRDVAENKLLPLTESLYLGGIRLIEITYGSSDDLETAKSIEMLKEKFDGKMHIGAGTILTEKQVELTKTAGGEFIVSPNVFPDLITKSLQLGMVSIPGALTPSEICIAQRAGADFIKLFPASNMGEEYIKAVLAPLKGLRLLAVGGINTDNLIKYLAAGACGVGIGKNIVNRHLLASDAYDEISALAGRYVNITKTWSAK